MNYVIGSTLESKSSLVLLHAPQWGLQQLVEFVWAKGMRELEDSLVLIDFDKIVAFCCFSFYCGCLLYLVIFVDHEDQ